MTVPSETGASRYTGNGATSTYNYGFYIQDDDDLEVIVTSTTDVDTTLTKTTHYTVSGAGDSGGGSITLISPWNNLTSGYSLTIRLRPDLNNQSAFRNGNVNGPAIEDALDRMSQRIIRLKDDVDRSLKLPTKEAGSAATTVIADATDRASKYLGFDADGEPTLSATVAEGSLAVTAIGETIVEAANAGAVLDALGFTTFTKTIVDDTTAAGVQTTLGITAAAQSILDDASVSAIRTTLGLDGASGAISALDIADAATAQIFQARLTLTSATPVTTADVTAAGTIYLTPYKGNKIAVYTGTRWKLMALTEISLALTATSGKNYDVWVYDNSGTLTLETTEWTNNTTRATALAAQDGVLCKTGALTRRYVGTFRASGSNTTEDSKAKRFLWSHYNRARKMLWVEENSSSWTYTTATQRQANNNAANQVEIVCGVSEDVVGLTLLTNSSNSTANVERYALIGVNTVTAGSFGIGGGNQTGCGAGAVTLANTVVMHHASVNAVPAVGYTYYAWIEHSSATGTTTWCNNSAGASGITGTYFC